MRSRALLALFPVTCGQLKLHNSSTGNLLFFRADLGNARMSFKPSRAVVYRTRVRVRVCCRLMNSGNLAAPRRRWLSMQYT